MAKGIMVVQSEPVDPAHEDEFNDWYDNTHIPEITAVPGFVSARRYQAHGQTHGTDALRLDPPPVVTFYQLRES